jgi:hypothetical protein
MTPKKKAQMLAAFEKFAARISGEYERALDALERDDYVTAHRVLSALTISHAKTSLSLRNQLVKDGLLKETE